MSTSIKEPLKVITCVSLGILSRLIITTNFKDTLRQRVEVTTPTSDWKRAHEAIYLWSSGLDPYSGNLYHEYPISLQFYKIISSYSNVDLAFSITDVMTAYLLYRSVFNQLLCTKHDEHIAKSRSWMVFMVYLFSPLTIISCAGQSTAIFTNFLISVICFILHIEQFRALTCVLCAFLACNNIYYATLILPIFLSIEYCSHMRQNKDKLYYNETKFTRSMWTSGGIYILSVVTLLLTSYMLIGNSWSFLKTSYLFVLKVQDLTPNIGMTWYFFTEMFEHFLDFFTWIVQINAFIHAIPVSFCLRDKPFFALYITMLLATIFQPYPNLSHVGIVTSLLPQYLDLFPHMKQGLKVSCATITCLSLMPVFWHLWIMMGTANSNFFFGATLAFSTSLILLMIDLLNANGYLYAKMKFDEYNKKEVTK